MTHEDAIKLVRHAEWYLCSLLRPPDSAYDNMGEYIGINTLRTAAERIQRSEAQVDAPRFFTEVSC